VLVAAGFLFSDRDSLPKLTTQRSIPVELVQVRIAPVRPISSAPPRARVTREEPPAPVRKAPTPPKQDTKQFKPAPEGQSNLKVSRKEPKIPPPRKKVEPPQPTNKVGAAESRQTFRSDLPAVGEMRGAMQIWAEGTELPYSYYFDVLQRKISSYWEPPVELTDARPGAEVAAVVWFRIERDGRVANRFVEEPSGLSLFDNSALRALQLASPLPPLPAEYAGEYLVIHLRFVYSS